MEWVLDATIGVRDGLACFVPIEKDGSLVLGLNMLGHCCPGKLVGVIHMDGQGAVERWIKENPDWQKYAKDVEGDTMWPNAEAHGRAVARTVQPLVGG